MYLLYCDESGNPGGHDHRFFVLAGIAVHEKQAWWISKELDTIAAKFNSATPQEVELHGNPMQGGKKFWRDIPTSERRQAIKDALGILATSHSTNRIFACVIEKASASPLDPVSLAFEQVSSRFDMFLTRLHIRKNDSQRGLMIFDKSTYESTIQALATLFREQGHTYGKLRNLAEVPLFIDSRASRMIQLADLVAYALFRYYELGDDSYYQVIQNRFDSDGGIQHGFWTNSPK